MNRSTDEYGFTRMNLFFELLQMALGMRDHLSRVPTAVEWEEMYDEAVRQSVASLMVSVIERLPAEQSPPIDIKYEWIGDLQAYETQNKWLNAEARRLTEVFAAEGRRSAILKGQANALLYPNRLLRKPGDIDIWVEGGRKSVKELLDRLGMTDDHTTSSYHHFHLSRNEQGIVVEVHFRPSSGNQNPWTNRRLQRFLNDELSQLSTCEEGFCVPSVPFALVMQLAHIQRHFFGGGVGLRQIVDYLMLLRSSTADERAVVSRHLKRFGLLHFAGALMWLLSETMNMEAGLMLCEPDGKRGRRLLSDVMEGGSFGWYSKRMQIGLFRGFFKGRLRQLSLVSFDYPEGIWAVIDFWKEFVRLIPKRIAKRRLSLRGGYDDGD